MSKRLRTTHTPRVYFGDVIYEPGGGFGPRVQQDFQLVVIVAGEVRVTVDERSMSWRADEVALLHPGHREFFHFSEKRPTHHTWCAIDPVLITPELARRCADAAAVLPVTERMAQLMEMGLSLPRAAGNRAPGLIEALGLAALNEYLYAGVSGASAPARESSEPDALRRALEWIGQHGAEPLDLRSLARQAGVSRAQLVKLFKQHLGATPMRHVWETRTRQGMRLLRDTGLTVSEIAARCGFSTPFHFSRWVRTVSGVAPREFRARAWGPGVNGQE